MKTILSVVLVMSWVALGSAGELKVATVDLQRVFVDYYKAQEAARHLKEQEVSFVKELEKLSLDGRRLIKEVEDLRRLALDNVLSTSAREEKRKCFELKLTDLRAFELKYQETKSQREAELQAQSVRVNRSILDDVLSATRSLGEKEGFNLILNANRANPGASDVLFAKNVEDLTGKVLVSLNGTRTIPRPEPNERGDRKAK